MAEVRFQVPGMTCDHCVRAVQEEVGGVAGVVSVEVDLASKDVVVKTDGTTVPQKAERKLAFLVLWRRVCWATMAPGQPPTAPQTRRVLSGTRQRPAVAADLSTA